MFADIEIDQIRHNFPDQITDITELDGPRLPLGNRVTFLVHADFQRPVNYISISRFDADRLIHDPDKDCTVLYGFLWDNAKKSYEQIDLDGRFAIGDQQGRIWRLFRTQSSAMMYATYLKLAGICKGVNNRLPARKKI